ncbi:MAG: hypothetical protein J6R74_07185, partial [Tidjanibacter sp.]|nr:hypothetical protein [Tidjanibacter sp.]
LWFKDSGGTTQKENSEKSSLFFISILRGWGSPETMSCGHLPARERQPSPLSYIQSHEGWAGSSAERASESDRPKVFGVHTPFRDNLTVEVGESFG